MDVTKRLSGKRKRRKRGRRILRIYRYCCCTTVGDLAFAARRPISRVSAHSGTFVGPDRLPCGQL